VRDSTCHSGISGHGNIDAHNLASYSGEKPLKIVFIGSQL